MRYPIVLFDIDGTLLDTSGTGIKALNRMVLELFGLKDAFAGYNFAGRTDLGIIRDAFQANFKRHYTPEELDTCLGTYLRYLEEELGRPGHRVKVLPGVPQALELLTRTGVHVGLATGNLQRGAALKLKAAGLDHFFAFGGFGSDHEDRALLTALAAQRGRERAGLAELPGDSILVVGDSPLDIKAAHGARLHVLSVCTGWNSPEELGALGPEHLLPDLSDAQALLAIVNG